MAKVDRALAAQLKAWIPQKQQRLSLSDDLAAPRDIDHFAYFKRPADADRAKAAFEAAGFAVLTDSNGRNIALQASRRDALTEVDLTSALREVLAIVIDSRGDYDGFGAEVVAPKA